MFTNETDIVVLEILKRIQARMDLMASDIGDIKVRVKAVEGAMAGVNRRLDRTDERLDRIERRLDLVDAK